MIMKKIYLLSAIALVLGLSACTHTELDPLTGLFPAPTEVTLSPSAAQVNAYTDEAGRRIFDLEINDAGTSFAATLVGDKYYLTSNQYSEAIDAVAKKGNFILGRTSVNGKAVKQGTITVDLVEETPTDEGCENTYSLSTVIFLEDGTPYKIFWNGRLSFEKDAVLVPAFYYTDAVATDCTDSDNVLYEDVESHTLTIKDPDGNFAAQIKLIRAAGTTYKGLAGNYTVKEYAHEDFTAGNGFDLGIYYGMAPGAFVIGSYYISDGTVMIINAGETISVSEVADGGFYSIDGDGFSFLAAPEGYVPGGATVYDITDAVASDCTDADNVLYEDVESHTLTLKDDTGALAAQIKLIRSVGTEDLTGEYTVTEYAHEDFTAGNGFDLGVFYGMDPGAFVIGSYYFDEDGALVIVQPGETISVSKSGDIYTFEGSTGWSFMGRLVVPDDPGPGPEPQPGDEVTLSEFLSLTDYSGYGISMVGIELGTEGFYYQAPDWQTTWTPSYPVDGQFIKLELYAEGGVIAPGTYVPSAENGTVAAGEFNLGADNGWGGFNGTSWFTVASGAATGVAVTDGTVTVSEADGVYTIVIETSAVKATYIGKLAPEAPVELSEFLSLTDYSGYGMSMVGIELGTEGFYYQAPDWQTTWTPSYPVDGQFIKLELYAEGGVIAPGTYVPSAENGTVAAGEFNLGADNGWGGFNGTSWFTVASGAATGVAVTDGTVTVSEADGVYTIVIETSAVKASYTGKLSAE